MEVRVKQEDAVAAGAVSSLAAKNGVWRFIPSQRLTQLFPISSRNTPGVGH